MIYKLVRTIDCSSAGILFETSHRLVAEEKGKHAFPRMKPADLSVENPSRVFEDADASFDASERMWASVGDSSVGSPFLCDCRY